MHPAELPIRAIFQLLPPNTELTGIWVQNPSDATSPYPEKVAVSVQWKSKVADYVTSESGVGPNVRDASRDLMRKMSQHAIRALSE